MRKPWEIERGLYGFYVPFVKTIHLDNGVTENVEERMLLNFRDTNNPEDINYIIFPSFGGNDSFKKVDRFVFNRDFNYCEYPQYDQEGELVCQLPGGYVDFGIYAQCGNRLYKVTYRKTRNQAKRLTHKLNRCLAEGKRIYHLKHNGFNAL